MNSFLLLALAFFPYRTRGFVSHRYTEKWSKSIEMSMEDYDLVVVGGGVVGVQAALSAASPPFSKNVCLVDAPRASGMLMNEATGEDLSLGAPTGLFGKALRDTSKRIKVSTLRGMGLREESVWNEIISSCVDLASANAQDIVRQLDTAGVTYVQGFACFPDSGGTKSLLITKDDQSIETITAKYVLLATGSKPFRPAGIPFDNKRILDSDSINQMSRLPRSIAISGSGIIAVEFAKIFRNLGAEVTLIIRDSVPRNALMKVGLDIDVAATLVKDIVRSGIKIQRGSQVKDFVVPKDNELAQVSITLEARGGGPLPSGVRTELKCDTYLAAVGRTSNTGSLNLRPTGIELDEYGGIVVDSNLKTTAKDNNVYAAGDAIGRPFLASTGSAQGQAAVNSMFSESEVEEDISCDLYYDSNGDLFCDPKNLLKNPFAFPTGVWSSPEASYYGYTLQSAKEAGIDADESISLYAECLRGRVFSPNGILKLVFDKPTGRILGVHICGDDACELIHYGMELVKGERTVNDLTKGMFTAVTYHEMYRIAAQAAQDPVQARKRRTAAGKALAQRNRMVRRE